MSDIFTIYLCNFLNYMMWKKSRHGFLFTDERNKQLFLNRYTYCPLATINNNFSLMELVDDLWLIPFGLNNVTYYLKFTNFFFRFRVYNDLNYYCNCECWLLPTFIQYNETSLWIILCLIFIHEWMDYNLCKEICLWNNNNMLVRDMLCK